MFTNKVYQIIERALEEDLNNAGDITTDNLLSKNHNSTGIIKAREEGVIAGLNVAEMVFKYLDNNIMFKASINDGDRVKAGDKIAKITGSTRTILKGERTALNFLQRLSGIATKTNEYLNLVEDYSVRITDTRKTTPCLRLLEKYAVKTGGGNNHRMGLFDAVMIKDNHILAAGGIKKAVKTIKEKIAHTTKIEVEVENFQGVKDAVDAGADIIMLDNMNPEQMKKAVEYIDKRAIVEASGGIDKNNIKQIAETGVDIISIGALTHQIESLDISLDLKPAKKDSRFI